MKKILLASTALVLSAGLAHAQGLTFSGEGRMGIQYDSTGGTLVTGAAWAPASNWRQENRLTLNFNVAVQADHGLSFGAWTRARMQVDPAAPAAGTLGTAQGGTFSGSRVWVEANGLRLTFGNQDGAIATAGTATGFLGCACVGYVGGITTADMSGLFGVVQRQNNNGTDNQPMIGVQYTMGDVRVAVSHSRGNATEIGVRARFDAITVAAGFSNNGAGASFYTVGAHYNAGSWGAGLTVARIGANTNFSLVGNASVGGGTLSGFVGRIAGASTYGLGYAYSLGGGATLSAGVERWSGIGTAAVVGVAFTF